jgi:hypothetical protein
VELLLHFTPLQLRHYGYEPAEVWLCFSVTATSNVYIVYGAVSIDRCAVGVEATENVSAVGGEGPVGVTAVGVE